MNSKQNEKLLIFLLITLVTIVFGFVAWWTLPLVAFGASWLVARKAKFSLAVQLGTLAPACGWIFTALVRDLFENTRMSQKLAGLLHLGFGFFVYLGLFVIVALVSFFAAWSGAETSKALR